MPMPAVLREVSLTVHVVTSVGWLGAVGAFLALALSGITAEDPVNVRALYVAMELLGVAVLVPLSLASFASGLVQSLGTPWGLFRHYWVIVKLSISVVATVILLVYTSTLALLSDAAASSTLADDAALLPSTSPVLHSGAAVVVLLLAAGLSVFKPKGLTRYGWRKQRRRADAGPVGRATSS
jgi:hypothetical protein